MPTYEEALKSQQAGPGPKPRGWPKPPVASPTGAPKLYLYKSGNALCFAENGRDSKKFLGDCGYRCCITEDIVIPEGYQRTGTLADQPIVRTK